MISSAAALALVVTLLQVVLVPLISLAKQERFGKQVNALLALALAAAGGTLVTVLTGGLAGLTDPTRWTAIMSATYTASQLVYHALFADSPLDRALTGVGAPVGNLPPAPKPEIRKQGR
jgi:hypothetical protein